MKLSMPTGRTELAILGIVLAVVLFFAVNLFSNTMLRQARVDLTEGRLFTLSEGTRSVLATIPEPLTLRFYLSRSLVDAVPAYGNYAGRVRELLDHYASLAKDKLHVKIYDPQPYSVTEDDAVSAGLQGVPVNQSGELAYFGLAASNSTDDHEIVPFFDPRRESHLEYDLTRLIFRLAFPKKKVVGILTNLPFQGDPMRGLGPWGVVEQMHQFFEVRPLDLEPTTIPSDVDVLLAVHTGEMSDQVLYAIDQYVLGGGRALFFVDPFSESASGPNPGAVESQTNPSVNKLFAAWGIDFEANKVVTDGENAVRVNAPGPQGRPVIADYLAWINLGPEYINQGDVVASQLSRIAMASVGSLSAKAGAGTEFTPLLHSSPTAMRIDAKELMGNPDPIRLINKFVSENRSFTIAARVRGNVKSAFPNGAPVAPVEPTAPATPGAPAATPATPAEPKPAAAAAKPQLMDSTAPINVVVVADTDILADRFWLQNQDFFGQRVRVPTANNGDLVFNILDNLSGSNALVDLRGRGLSSRPFDLVKEIQGAAEVKYRRTEQELMGQLNDTQRKLSEVQVERSGESGTVILSDEQKSMIGKFRADLVSIRQQLRNVQLALKQDIDGLQTVVKIVNIWAMPVVVSLIALVMALVRRSRRRRRAEFA
ncbi:MAG: ABC transporter [Rhodospirillales bacterium]|nr:ABC transporter [Rhodospirillales bacterium]